MDQKASLTALTLGPHTEVLMKATYAAPTAVVAGDVVHATLSGKVNADGEPTIGFKPSTGSNLSFGL